MYDYSVFGLRVRTSGPLPGLTRLTSAQPGDVAIHLGTLPPGLEQDSARAEDFVYVSPHRDEAGRPLLTVRRQAAGQLFRLHYADGTEFVIDRLGTTVWTRWPEPWTLDDVATYLLSPVLAFVLRLRGITCLHASAIALGQQAIAFVGPAGAGKSTLAATFARRGHAVVSDDVVALSWRDERFFVESGAPRIRLWPESVLALYGSTEVLPRLTPTWEKRFLDVIQHGHVFQRRPLPLAAVYVLDGRRSMPSLPSVETLSAAESLMMLIANTHANHLLDETMRAEEFECLSRLVTFIPVRRVSIGEDPTLRARLCEVVLDDAQALPVPLEA